MVFDLIILLKCYSSINTQLNNLKLKTNNQLIILSIYLIVLIILNLADKMMQNYEYYLDKLEILIYYKTFF